MSTHAMAPLDRSDAEDDVTTIAAPLVWRPISASHSAPLAVAARTNHAASAAGTTPAPPPSGEALPEIVDEKTFEYTLGEPSALDEPEGAWRPSAGESSEGVSGQSFRAAVLPRTRAQCMAQGGFSAGPRFELRGRLGGGASGVVSLELDRDIGRPVAVKRLTSPDPEMVMRFADEVRTTGGLEHPNIVPIHDVGIDEDQRYYFVMKYLEGETLESIIRRLAAGDREYHRRYPVERRADICMEVMNALDYAHSRGIVHRDVKPANIMIGTYGEVMLMDWGVAKRSRESEQPESAPPARGTGAGGREDVLETQAGELVGTPYYMSPEQARGDNPAVDARSDIYSLSVVMHELFTLRHYLADQKTLPSVLEAIKQEDRAFTAFVQDIFQATLPCEIMHFVRKGMRKAPAERYQSMAEMIDAFQTARSGRFRIQCYFTLMKRVAQSLVHFIDAHPVVVTLVFALGVLAIPTLLVLVVRSQL